MVSSAKTLGTHHSQIRCCICRALRHGKLHGPSGLGCWRTLAGQRPCSTRHMVQNTLCGICYYQEQVHRCCTQCPQRTPSRGEFPGRFRLPLMSAARVLSRRKWCVWCGTPRRGCKYFTLAKKEAPSALRVHSGVDLRFVANLSFCKRDVG